jgi:hypothetical protein
MGGSGMAGGMTKAGSDPTLRVISQGFLCHTTWWWTDAILTDGCGKTIPLGIVPLQGVPSGQPAKDSAP